MADPESLFDVLSALGADVTETRKHKTAEGNVQFWRRSRIRTIFSVIEAWIYVSKQRVLSRTPQRSFSRPDLAMLYEETYDVDKDGAGSTQAKFIPVEKNFKFVYRMLALVYESGFTLDTSSSGWAAFKIALKARNRITHPRTAADLEISDSEIDSAEEAFKWFMETSVAATKRPASNRQPNSG